MRKLATLFALLLTLASVVFSQTKTPEHCPAISIVGPAGITRTGDSMTFATDPPFDDREGLSFHWTISAGTIIKGERSQVLEVRTTPEMNNTSVTATVNISGLPMNCPSTASETAAVSSGSHPTLIDEFGKLPLNDVRGRLDAFFGELLSNKDQVGVVLLRYPESSPEAKILQRKKRIEDHIKFRRFPRNRIVILSHASTRESTQLYRMPEDAVDLYCSECKKY